MKDISFLKDLVEPQKSQINESIDKEILANVHTLPQGCKNLEEILLQVKLFREATHRFDEPYKGDQSFFLTNLRNLDSEMTAFVNFSQQ